MIRIAKLETYANEFVCFVRLTTDAGTVGWGVEIHPAWQKRAAYQCSELPR